MQALNPKIIDILLHGTKEERIFICQEEPIYFAVYHFPEFFIYPIAPFHYDFCEDYKRLMRGDISTDVWIAFRESAKTSWKKILIVHAICYRLKRFINYDSYDKENSEAALFDIANWLQTKGSLIEDYGHLLPTGRKTKSGEAKKIQRVSKFITKYGIMVQAFSTQEPVRGRVFNEVRPDWIVFDDIETNKTKKSRAIIQSIIDHFNEARTGISSTGSISVLGNFILDDGVIAYILEAYKNNDRASIRNIPVIKGGQTTWPGKYVMTNFDAMDINHEIADRAKQKVSLEAKKEDLKPEVFEPEMMNNPSGSGDLFFERRLVEAAIERAKDPIEINAGLKIWARYNPKHRYGMGADTAEGIGGDSNASIIIDFTVKPNLVVASFEDNQLAANVFGAELKREGALYAFPYLVPEINNTGYATVAELINDPQYPELYQREVRNKTTQKIQKEYGWKATVGTKWEVLGEFKSAFEDGELEILDLGLLEEMKHMRKTDARLAARDKGATKHFDKLRAAALAWHANKYAPLPADDKRDKYFNIPGQKEPYKI